MASRRRDDGDDWAALLFVAAAALGIGGLVYGADQQQKREQEAARFRQELKMLRAALAEKEAALENLAARLGPKSEQVRLLVTEIEQLRAQVGQRLHRA